MVCHFLGYRQFCNIRQHIITLQCHQNESVLRIRNFIISYFPIVRTYEITNTSENGLVYNLSRFNMFHSTGSIIHLIEESCKGYKKMIFQYHFTMLSNIFCLRQQCLPVYEHPNMLESIVVLSVWYIVANIYQWLDFKASTRSLHSMIVGFH